MIWRKYELLKRDYKKEIENSLKIVKEKVDEALITKEYDEALNLINRELRSIVGLDLTTVDTLSFDSVKGLLSRERQYNSERYVALAEILRLRAILAENPDEEIYYNYKALLAYIEGLEDDEFLEDCYKNNVHTIINSMRKYELSIEEDEAIFNVYEVMKEFDKAEDSLFEMIDKTNKDEEIINKGIEFYNRLLEIDEDILEAGNLPIEEVKDSLKEIKNYL